MQNYGILAKKHGILAKFTAFDENHGIRDFPVSVIFYCPYTYSEPMMIG